MEKVYLQRLLDKIESFCKMPTIVPKLKKSYIYIYIAILPTAILNDKLWAGH